MKTIVFLSLAVATAIFTSCELYENIFPKDEDLSFVADITEGTDYHFLAFAKSDGSFLAVKQANGLPVETIIKPSANREPFPVWFSKEGYPERMIIKKYIILFERYTNFGFDMAMINPDGEVTVMREVIVPQEYREFLRLKSVKTADALRQAGHFINAVTNAIAVLGNAPEILSGYSISQEAASLLKNPGNKADVLRMASGYVSDDNIPLLSALPAKSVVKLTGSNNNSSGNAVNCLLSLTGVTLGIANSVMKENGEEMRLAKSALLGGYGDIQVTLTWDTPTDIDLYVQDPSGDWVWFRNKQSASGGHLDIDNTSGFGPENIFWEKNGAPNGTFKAVIENFEGISTNYYILVQAFGQTKQFHGTINTKQELSVAEFSKTYLKKAGITQPETVLPFAVK